MRSQFGTLLISLAIAVLMYFLLCVDLWVRLFLTPTLIEAVKGMSLVEALFLPRGVLDLWIAVRVVESPINSAIFVLIITCVTALIIRLLR